MTTIARQRLTIMLLVVVLSALTGAVTKKPPKRSAPWGAIGDAGVNNQDLVMALESRGLNSGK